MVIENLRPLTYLIEFNSWKIFVVLTPHFHKSRNDMLWFRKLVKTEKGKKKKKKRVQILCTRQTPYRARMFLPPVNWMAAA